MAKKIPFQPVMFQDPSRDVKPLPTFKQPAKRVWTDMKAQLIANYLKRFVYITRHGAYIDGFAGPQYPDQPDAWSARLVLQQSSMNLENNPRRLTKFFLVDADPKQIERLTVLASSLPEDKNRKLQILQGDCNKVLQELFHKNRPKEDGPIRQKEATFCLLDQRNVECQWKTVSTLASYKKPHKIELFYFLAQGWLNRSLKTRTKAYKLNEVREWWGGEDWKIVTKMPAARRAQVMVERFKSELGYKYVQDYPIYESKNSGRVMYTMIHASDHFEAMRLMGLAYRFAGGSPVHGAQDSLGFVGWEEPAVLI